MGNIRVRFIRGEEVKYISHLDLMKAFERAIRRSGMPIAYSQGFNPHPQMVFGLPLSVGVTSEAEYADFELSGDVEPQDFLKALNNNLPKGFIISEARERRSKGNIMASIAAAAYETLLSSAEKLEDALIQDRLGRFLKETEIMVEKEGKNGTKEIDIRPMIHRLDLSNNSLKPGFSVENIFGLSMLLSAGSSANLKPELLVKALGRYFDTGIRLVKIHRTELLVNNGKELTDPLDDGVL